MFFLNKLKLFLLIKYINALGKLKLYDKSPIYYIGGSEALPPPLSNDEESFLLNKLEKSDYGVKSILIERNLHGVIRKLKIRSGETSFIGTMDSLI